MSHPLHNKWVFWEQSSNPNQKTYGSGDREIFEFETVEDFWKYWSFVPKPSEVFTDTTQKKEIEGRVIGSFCVFKKGIKPEWEDPANRLGSEYFCRTIKSLEIADLIWENLVLGLIGETIDEENYICGCRIVNKPGNRFNTKVELWLSTRQTEVTDRIKVRLLDCLAEDSTRKEMKNLDFQFKIHGEN